MEERYNEDNQLQYLIKWEGEDEEYATWESYDEVSSSWSHLLQMFNHHKRTKITNPNDGRKSARTDIIVIADDDSGGEDNDHSMPIESDPHHAVNDRYLRSKSAYHRNHGPKRRDDYYKEPTIPYHSHSHSHHQHPHHHSPQLRVP